MPFAPSCRSRLTILWRPSEAGEPAVIRLLHDEASELSLSRTPMAAPSRPAEQAGSERLRQSTMAILVAASAAELAAAEAAIGPLPGFRHLRRPEAGLLMLRGRIGGEGARFNLGEATVTRCLVVTDGFYEWQSPEDRRQPRQPFRFTVDGGAPFAFAGLWTRATVAPTSANCTG